MFKKIGLGLFAVVILLVLVGFLLPAKSRIERSVTIAAPPADVFVYINDLKRFNEWSPWYDKDPNTEYRFEGPEQGVGAKVYWNSEHTDVGTGSQEIIESEQDRHVRTALDFGPMGKASATFDLQSDGDGSALVWGLDNDFGNNLVGRYFGLMLDGMVGAEYETGLAKLKVLVEGG